MSLRRFFVRSFAVTAFALAAVATQGCSAEAQDEDSSAAAAQTQSRPPQFVLLAFDGSYNNAFWEESRTFAKENNLHFTYFVNPSYYVARPHNMSCLDGQPYQAPGHGAGQSNIGWGDSSDDIKIRLEHTAQAFAEGNEIGSHTVGHFDGTGWSQAYWEQEFQSFDKMFWNAAKIAQIPEVNLGFTKKDIIGFRAPQLGISQGLYTTLANHDFVYDTSKTNAPNYWPQKLGGVWNFPLANLVIAHSGKKTLSMDYNFFYADSNGVNDKNPANYATYERNMTDTYMAYFQNNYYGNRAPVHIGHHFSKWNGGAYWNAMRTLAKNVCGLPEVKCVTYKELATFMEANAAKRDDWQAGNFPKMVRPPSAKIDESVVSSPEDDPAAAREDEHAHDEEVQQQ